MNYLPLLEPISRKDNDHNARCAWWLCTSTYALGLVVVPSAPHCSLPARTQTKEISLPSYFRRRGAGRSRQKIERIFLWFWIAASSSKKFHFSLHLFESLPLHFSPYSRRVRRASDPNVRGNSEIHSHAPAPPHSPLTG